MFEDKIEYIDFRSMPGFSRLFLDYIEGKEEILRFYSVNPFDETVRIPRPLSGGNRSGLIEILTAQNKRFGCSEKTFRNIERLSNPDTRAVLTGQQAGIIGGPLYTIYKAITAIQLAGEYDKCGIPAVPVFWLETNDHDFEEIRSAAVLDAGNKPVHVRYEADGIPEGKPVGAIPVFEGIGLFIRQLRENLQETEYTSELIALLEETYIPGVSFGEAFARLMGRLFSRYGMILFDPSDPGAGELAKEFYLGVMERGEEITRRVLAVSRELEEAGYHAQVRLPEGSAHLFVVKDGKRRLLRRGEAWMIGELESSREEMMEIIGASPALVSPTVLTRPLLQDYLFPTIAYVGGPSEIAYWAQVKPLYELFGMTMPAVYPRAGGTLLETRILRLIEKHNLSLEGLFAHKDETVKNMVRNAAPEEGDRVFGEFLADVGRHAEILKKITGQAEETLAGAVDTMKEKIEYQVERIRQKYEKALEKKYATIAAQGERIASFFHPNGNLQERELNAAYFLARHGLALIGTLMERIPPDTRRHFVMEI